MKRRIRVSARLESRSLAYLEVSPSKRQTLRKRSLPLTTTTNPELSSASNSSASCVDQLQASVDADYSSLDHSESGSDACQSEELASSYMKRQQRLAENWSEIRDQMLRAAVEFGIPFLATCNVCGNPAIITCLECGPQAFYCEDCVEGSHHLKNIFHSPRIWKVYS